MKIELLAPPYSGHLHPVLGIARALQERHAVTVLCTPGAQHAIRACGLRGEAVLSAEDEASLWALANPPRPVRAHPLRLHAQVKQTLRLMARLHATLAQRWAVQRPGLVIADFTLPTAGLLAQRLGIRWWTSLPSPCVLETPDGPPPYVGGLFPSTGWMDALQHAAARRLTRLFKRGVHAWHGAEMRALELPAMYRADGSEAVYSPERILALGIPELEFAQQWPAALRFVGPMLCTPPSDLPEPPFVNGSRHLLVTAGTHLDWAKQGWIDAATGLARRHPDWQVHVSQGRAGGAARAMGDAPHNLHVLAFVDYERFLARYDMVLHHGGAGVMYHALRAGVPALVHPLDYDQFDHAARLQSRGAGLWLRQLDDLPAAFDRARADHSLFTGLPALRQAVHRHIDAQRLLDLIRHLEPTPSP
jgi:UDP:flavonoid glycosyltransferase YjiC (YdhE family)